MSNCVNDNNCLLMGTKCLSDNDVIRLSLLGFLVYKLMEPSELFRLACEGLFNIP